MTRLRIATSGTGAPSASCYGDGTATIGYVLTSAGPELPPRWRPAMTLPANAEDYATGTPTFGRIMYSIGADLPPVWGAPPSPGPTLPANSEDYATGDPTIGYIMYSVGSDLPPVWGAPPSPSGGIVSFETFPLCISGSHLAAGATGRTNLTRIIAPGDLTVSLVTIYSLATGATSFGAAIYDATGARVAVSAATGVSGAGFLAMPLTVPYSLVAETEYYVGISQLDAAADLLTTATLGVYGHVNRYTADSFPPVTFNTGTAGDLPVSVWSRLS